MMFGLSPKFSTPVEKTVENRRESAVGRVKMSQILTQIGETTARGRALFAGYWM
jgi:hypothetical protein